MRGWWKHFSRRGGRGLRFFLFRRLPSPLRIPLLVFRCFCFGRAISVFSERPFKRMCPKKEKSSTDSEERRRWKFQLNSKVPRKRKNGNTRERSTFGSVLRSGDTRGSAMALERAAVSMNRYYVPRDYSLPRIYNGSKIFSVCWMCTLSKWFDKQTLIRSASPLYSDCDPQNVYVRMRPSIHIFRVGFEVLRDEWPRL